VDVALEVVEPAGAAAAGIPAGAAAGAGAVGAASGKIIDDCRLTIFDLKLSVTVRAYTEN